MSKLKALTEFKHLFMIILIFVLFNQACVDESSDDFQSNEYFTPFMPLEPSAQSPLENECERVCDNAGFCLDASPDDIETCVDECVLASLPPEQMACLQSAQCENIFLCVPQSINFGVEAVIIGPTKIDGASWDAGGSVSGEDVSSLLNLLGSIPSLQVLRDVAQINVVNELISRASNLILGTLAKPDPVACVTLELGGVAGPEVCSVATDNNYYGQIGIRTTQPIQLDRNTLLRVRLYDQDLRSHDPIGNVTIPATVLFDASLVSSSVWLKISDETQRQALLLQISVQPVF